MYITVMSLHGYLAIRIIPRSSDDIIRGTFQINMGTPRNDYIANTIGNMDCFGFPKLYVWLNLQNLNFIFKDINCAF